MRKPTCLCCGSTHATNKIQVNRRGKEGHAYLCDDCYSRNQSYFTDNNKIQGTAKKNQTTVGVEFETSYSTEKARIEFVASGYIPTHDATVDVEYKSPIMQGLNSISKHCVTFEKLIQDGQLEVNYSCGTHFHVGNTEYINSTTIDYMRRFYHSLFIPLCQVMDENPEKTEQLFGRGFGHWCSTINEYTDAQNHTNFINLQHDKTIEFRMCKFINASQYMNCAKFCVEVANCIIKNFINHFNYTDFDTRRYENIKMYRRHKAQVTANKLVKLFEKYTNN